MGNSIHKSKNKIPDQINIPITRVVVGSRLHGLENEKSDFDYRGIFIGSLKQRLSPFRQFKTTSWIEGDKSETNPEDNTTFELANFCQMATQGNATILEVFFSDYILEDSPIADEMRQNWTKFMDTQRFVDASFGYAKNNKKKFEERNPLGVKGQLRQHKFGIAYARVLWQCIEFLKTGVFKCRIDEGEFRDKLLRWKNNWDDEYTLEALGTFYELEGQLSELEKTSPYMGMKPDIEWIEDFIYRAYMSTELKEETLDDILNAYERGETNLTAAQVQKLIKKNS